MTESSFDELATAMAAEGVAPALARLAAQLGSERKYHELFDVRLMAARHRLGLPVAPGLSFDELDDAVREPLEEAYLAACREVGGLLLAEGQLREAWMYLRPTGDKTAMAAALTKIDPTEENVESLVEIALHEGVCPTLGYRLVLSRFGTCNAISMFDSIMHNRPLAERRELAGLLVRHVHRELLANLRADIARREAKEPEAADGSRHSSIRELIEGREWLFADLNYHLDTSHLSATIRLARLVIDPEVLALALDLTAYGRRLAEPYQYPGEEPFRELYQASALFFQAQLGEQVDAALAYFRDRASGFPIDEVGPGPVEVYVALLARTGRVKEAFRAAVELVPSGAATSGFAPSLLELAGLSGDYEELLRICRQRDDRLGFAAALVQSRLARQ